MSTPAQKNDDFKILRGFVDRYFTEHRWARKEMPKTTQIRVYLIDKGCGTSEFYRNTLAKYSFDKWNRINCINSPSDEELRYFLNNENTSKDLP